MNTLKSFSIILIVSMLTITSIFYSPDKSSDGKTGLIINNNIHTIDDKIYVSFGLTKGWNLISIPFITTNKSVESVLYSIKDNYDIVQYYDSSNITNHWLTYSSNKPNTLNKLKTINHTIGLWIHMTKNATIIGNGTIPISSIIVFNTGWNLIGYPSLKNRTADELFRDVPSNIHYEIQRFDKSSRYNLKTMSNTNEVFHMGLGYWIFFSKTWQITIDW